MTARMVPHDPAWRSAFEAEAAEILRAMGPSLEALHHIGSTSIPAILAKPVIDMLGAASSLDDIERAAFRLNALGYTAMGAYSIEGRLYFRKDDASGDRTHHLHIYEAGSPHIVRHLAFRDYLRSHPEKAQVYSDLKAELVAAGVPYQEGKDAFVEAMQAEALAWQKGLADGS
jgi:GrpB-like predicted nucleotidyltransferase (UPF0157 family)